MTLPLEMPTVIFMVVIHVLAVAALTHVSLSGVIAFFILYWVTACLGVTLGYHRLLSHRSFKAPRWLTRFLATCGALSAQMGPIDWAGVHRQHHKYADTDKDPHNSKKGFWWSHIGWIMCEKPARVVAERFTRDLNADPYLKWLNKWFLLLQAPVAAALFAVGGWATVLWGIFLRLAVVYHCTWLVNSATHFWGKKETEHGDDALNNKWVAALTFGEGWHDNHHAYPNSARQGFGDQVDITWEHIKVLRKWGWITDVQVAPL